MEQLKLELYTYTVGQKTFTLNLKLRTVAEEAIDWQYVLVV